MPTERKPFDLQATATSIADLFGVSKMAVSKWMNRHDAPKPQKPGPSPRWSLGEVLRWRLSRYRSPDSTESSDLKDQLDQTKIDLTRAKAEIEQLRLEKARGELVPMEQYRADLLEVSNWLRDVIDAAGAELCSRLVGLNAQEIRAAIDKWGIEKKALLRKACEE